MSEIRHMANCTNNNRRLARFYRLIFGMEEVGEQGNRIHTPFPKANDASDLRTQSGRMDMPMLKKWNGVATAMAATLVVLVGHAPPAASQQLAQQSATPQAIRDELRVNLYESVETLEPGKDSDSSQHQIMGATMEPLVKLSHRKRELEPSLAESWKVSPDGRKLTFQLRRGVQFHRGYGEMTSEDVQFGFMRQLDPNFKSRYVSDWRVVQSVEAPDKYTVVVNLTEPLPGFIASTLTMRSSLIVSKRAVQKMGKSFGTQPVATGPFQIESITPGVEIVLKAHEQYWGGAPLTKRIVAKPIPEAAVAWNAFQAGDLDLLYTRNSEVFRQAKADSRLQVKTIPAMTVRTIHFNYQYAPTNNPLVRRALAHAINTREIVEVVLDGFGQVADSPVSPNSWSYTPVKHYPYDPDKAKQLLAEAGYPKGLTLKGIVTIPGVQELPALAVQAQLAKVGVKLELQTFERVALNAAAVRGDYHVTFQGLTRNLDPDSFLSVAWHGSQKPPGSNWSYYNGADGLITAVRTELNLEKRKQLSMQAQRKIIEDVGGVPYWYPINVVIHRPTVKNVVPNMNHELLLHRIYIDK